MPIAQLSVPSKSVELFAQSVLEGLSHPSQKWLSAEYLYDAVGSALFEAITVLPGYGLTRADARLLRKHAAEIVGDGVGPLHVIELGSGSAVKTRSLLEAAVRQFGHVRYTPIDVSAFALELCRAALERISGVEISLEENSYLPGLRRALEQRRDGERVLVLFLGSTIGNFPRADAIQFLLDIRNLLKAGDQVLLGTDIVKPVSELLPAYDDPAGVTAAFNRNLLVRINRELGGHFDPRAFEHDARFNPDESRVEMHLRSVRPQTVGVDALRRSFRFAAGETIWTESSYKFTPERITELVAAGSFSSTRQWFDDEWLFCESLLTAS